ncbi:MAG: prolyl oligopeptidase family serine peptidase [Anaerolineales bacterium]|nr:prolyl oligopeptidase family serine peptidase [Chloroflexota bacterium]MBL6980903.1 prolyl oligopeptidase family serine peptidase [Anaerolineales bacterium]
MKQYSVFAILLTFICSSCIPDSHTGASISTPQIVYVTYTPQIVNVTATPEPNDISTPGDHIVHLDVNGTERFFNLHIPSSYNPNNAYALVFDLHGFSGSARSQMGLSFMWAEGDKKGFIVVNPQGLGDPPLWIDFYPGEVGEAQIAFFEAMIAHLAKNLNIDPSRIYVTGMSNGGVMSNYLGCEMADTFAAIAPVAGGHNSIETCQPQNPISVIAVHGTDDRHIPYESSNPYSVTARYYSQAWAQRNGCDEVPIVEAITDKVTKESWPNCAENVAVVLYTVEGGRHEWPGSAYGPGPYPEGLQPEFYASEIIWEFFSQHTKPNVD